MSRETKTCIEWVCDDCKQPYGPDDYSYYLAEGETPDDWQVIDGLDVCDTCAEKRACVAAGGHHWTEGCMIRRWVYSSCMNCTATKREARP